MQAKLEGRLRKAELENQPLLKYIKQLEKGRLWREKNLFQRRARTLNSDRLKLSCIINNKKGKIVAERMPF
jgi:hypothetical protein